MTRTILVVEDDAAILKGLEDSFKREGYRVLTERDGKKGLRAAVQNQPDLVVLDVMLPGMDGFGVCTELKKQGFTQPVFMLTALANEQARLKGLEYGADDYIQKPFSIQELLLRVKNALARTDQVLGKARTMDEELRRAREIQLASLPKEPPTMKGIDLYGVMLPARHVGGDYYDFISLKDGTVALVVADVSGKGMPAALHVQKMQGIVQSSRPLISSPADLLVQLEEHLGATMDAASFVTAVAAIVDTPTNTVTIANAGHLPVLHRHGTTIRELKPDGLWIGALSTPTFRKELKTMEVRMKKGDRFLFFSDGVIEAETKRGKQFGMTRLKGALLRSNKGARQETEYLLRALERFAGDREQHDDITIVSLHYRG